MRKKLKEFKDKAVDYYQVFIEHRLEDILVFLNNRYQYFKLRLKKIISFLIFNRIWLLFVGTTTFIYLGSLLFWRVEGVCNPSVGSRFNCFYWIITTMSTVGYGDISPATTTGKIIAMVIMFVGVAFMGLFSGSIASKLVEHDIKGGMGMLDLDLEGHVVICGWNHHAKNLVDNILEYRKEDIAVIANLQQKPYNHNHVFFVRGDPTNETDLHRANIDKAKTAIVITDTSNGDLDSADARIILTTLAIETINPEVYTCAEIIDSKNITHLRNAHVDEVITSGEFSGRLMARTALSHGISKVITQLLTRNDKSDLQKVTLPRQLVGKTFDELFVKFRDKEDPIILVAVERGTDVIMNPPRDFQTEQGDNVIIISNKHPKPHELLWTS